jgi:hypothetical protein
LPIHRRLTQAFPSAAACMFPPVWEGLLARLGGWLIQEFANDGTSTEYSIGMSKVPHLELGVSIAWLPRKKTR